MFDDDAFRKIIDEKGLKMKAVAAAMGIKTSTLYRKRHGISDFTRAEIQLFVDYVGTVDARKIFFTQKVT